MLATRRGALYLNLKGVRNDSGISSNADYLFIEASFLEADADRALARSHLTARQAGELARRGNVARVIPFHFSARYGGREQEIRDELERAWQGG